MKKPCQYSVNLIEEGVLRSELHYGIFARDWWVSRSIENEDNNACSFSVPYRLHMRVTCILKQRQFLIAIVRNETNLLQPGFICTSGDIMSEVCLQPSTAVNTVYNKIFQTKTEHSGPAALGFNNEVIVKKLLREVEFQPLFLKIGQYLVVISNIGDSNGNGFISSLMITIKGKRNLLQHITNDKFILDFYQETNLILHYENESSNNVWKQIGIKQQENGSTLFGLNHTLGLWL
ncbi:7594_t:CDS:1 [Funneliformis geosporum]|nr:7594_t:CDS:1 [Funneliformis geosporum]